MPRFESRQRLWFAGLLALVLPDAALASYQTELRFHPYQTAARKAIGRLSSREGRK